MGRGVATGIGRHAVLRDQQAAPTGVRSPVLGLTSNPTLLSRQPRIDPPSTEQLRPGLRGVRRWATVPLGRGGGIGRHAVLRGPWAFACAGSNPALGTNLRDSARRGDVAKWLRRRSAKPLLGGSNPPVASIQTKPAGTPSRLPPGSGKAGGARPRHWPGVSPPSLTGIAFHTSPPRFQPARLRLLV